jgi:hypothetical protein
LPFGQRTPCGVSTVIAPARLAQHLSKGELVTAVNNRNALGFSLYRNVDEFELTRVHATHGWLYYDAIWTMARVSSGSRGADAVHLGDGLNLLVTSKPVKKLPHWMTALWPEWLFVFDHQPLAFLEQATYYSVVEFQNFTVSSGIDLSGRGWIEVTLSGDRHVLIRQPNVVIEDVSLDAQLQQQLNEHLISV